MESKFNLATNYTVIKASDELLAKIAGEVFGINWEDCLDSMGKLVLSVQQKVPSMLKEYKGKFVDQLKVWKGHNIVPAILRNEFASLISGNTVTPTFKANYIAMGSGSSTPANSDTKLHTETLRGTFTNRFSVDNVAYLDKFFSTAEVSGQIFSEIGVFVDGTASADTGYLLSRILINEEIGVNETLTINVTITIA